MDHARVGAELLRALRGRRSQAAFSRRLGFHSNVPYAWEAGRRFPTAAGLFRTAQLAGRDWRAGLEQFFRTAPEWLSQTDLAQPEGVVLLLNELRAGARIKDIASRTGFSRFAISRWFGGATQPRVPDFLHLVEATSLRLLDFLAALCDPAQLPSVAQDWKQLEAHRRVAYEVPWSQAVLRVLELEAYRRLPAHPSGCIADIIGIEPEEEARCLEVLQATGQIRKQDGRWVPDRVLTLDTRRDEAAGRRLKQWWAQVGLERLQAGSSGHFSYNLFTVSERDYQRIQELHANYFQGMRQIISQSGSSERVVLANLQLFSLDGGKDLKDMGDR